MGVCVWVVSLPLVAMGASPTANVADKWGASAMKDLGIDDKFIQDATKALPPNSSALFLMGRAEDPERFYEALGPYKATVATTTLSPEQEQRLKRVLAEEK